MLERPFAQQPTYCKLLSCPLLLGYRLRIYVHRDEGTIPAPTVFLYPESNAFKLMNAHSAEIVSVDFSIC